MLHDTLSCSSVCAGCQDVSPSHWERADRYHCCIRHGASPRCSPQIVPVWACRDASSLLRWCTDRQYDSSGVHTAPDSASKSFKIESVQNFRQIGDALVDLMTITAQETNPIQSSGPLILDVSSPTFMLHTDSEVAFFKEIVFSARDSRDRVSPDTTI